MSTPANLTMQRGTVRSFLTPFLTHPKIAQAIKWSVYSLLIINFGLYVMDDLMAYRAAIAPDAGWSEIMETFVNSQDVAAWLVLVFLLELETYILEDEDLEGWVGKAILLVSVCCYSVIVYAAYNYLIIAFENYKVTEVAGLTDLCTVADQGKDLLVNVVDYVAITAENCANISTGAPYYRIDVDISLVDAANLVHVQRMGWVDVVNSVTWLLIVLLIEIEVRLQAADRFGSRALKPVRLIKTALYGVLMVNIGIWLYTGYPLYSYDSCLWIFGFWAIEVNMAEWELERREELAHENPKDGAPPGETVVVSTD